MQTPELFKDVPRLSAPDPRTVLQDLGSGLVLRRGTEDDTDALVAFNALVHAAPPAYEPLQGIAGWTRDLLSGAHPVVRPSDFVLVHDTKTDQLAATTMLISQRFQYGGCDEYGGSAGSSGPRVEFAAGQPELVGTHPTYRRRGLVRRIFDVLHAWSEERGELLQIIDGIPWYYRQFGYEMALEDGRGQLVDKLMMPGPAADDAVRARPATAVDIPLFASLYAHTSGGKGISCLRDELQWRYELGVRHPKSPKCRILGVLESREGEALAVYAHANRLDIGTLALTFFQVAPRVARPRLTRPLLAELRRFGESMAERDGGVFGGAALFLGSADPLYDVARGRLRTLERAYAYYVRVPDLVRFLDRIRPELDARLAASVFAGQRSTLDLNLYRQGIRLVFEDGRVAAVESWQPDTSARGHVAFPDLSFLHLLMGHRSLAELAEFYPDCLIENEQRGALVEALFPKRPSNLWLVD